ncbi:hypothetical protein [Cupriavidus neocaledonicus]|uniref:Uncharacterized protein n=1 Tax=Cupriavidus neocaledonicus TaxID=1040979 RepID=A0A375HSR2_9BURK|nr:hypothetical protein [Cupriavidus neocaledonicus]SOZ37940.1 conserved hypothetical protein [Cupriavidus neocaledonicus]SPD61209.1 conserved protein of unknown function [Cupriavidus neocaledonicus]
MTTPSPARAATAPTRPHATADATTDLAALAVPDIPFGSLEAAAMAELPYTFRPAGTCTRYYNEFFG